MTDLRLKSDNIRVLDIDARVAFDRLFAERSIDHLYCLFPCPWPKKGHVKNRLFARAFQNMLNNRLKDGAQIYFVTDHQPYFDWVCEEVDQQYFQIETSSIAPQFDTKFERKWMAEGQKEFFELVLTKQKHFDHVIAKDVEVKSFVLKDFDPNQFSFKNVLGPINIIFKDHLYDAEQQCFKAMFIVSEQHLTQYFWVTIMKKKGQWRIFKSDGQKFFPTPGIVQTLEEVNKQIKAKAVRI